MSRFFTHFSVVVLFALHAVPLAFAQTTVLGTVMDIDSDDPVYGARIDLRTRNGLVPAKPLVSYTDAQGNFELKNVPDGNWRVRVMYGDAAVIERILMTPVFAAQGKSVAFHFKLNQDWVSFDEQLRYVRIRQLSKNKSVDHVTITGTVEELNTKKPISGARISFLEKADTTTTTLYRRAAQVTSNPSGQFEIPLLPPGSYLLDIGHASFETSGHVLIPIYSPIDLTIWMWKDGERPQVAGRVFDEQDRELEHAIQTTSRVYSSTLIGILKYNEQPLENASVYVLDTSGQPIRGLDVGKTDKTGVYRIEDIDPGTYNVRVESKEGVYEVDGVQLVTGVNEFNIQY